MSMNWIRNFDVLRHKVLFIGLHALIWITICWFTFNNWTWPLLRSQSQPHFVGRHTRQRCLMLGIFSIIKFMKLYFFQAAAKWVPLQDIWEKGNKIFNVHCNSGLFYILPLATLILIPMEDNFSWKKRYNMRLILLYRVNSVRTPHAKKIKNG